jgi:hypothetical protein
VEQAAMGRSAESVMNGSKSGLLYKQGHKVKNWKRRWFSLCGKTPQHDSQVWSRRPHTFFLFVAFVLCRFSLLMQTSGCTTLNPHTAGCVSPFPHSLLSLRTLSTRRPDSSRATFVQDARPYGVVLLDGYIVELVDDPKLKKKIKRDTKGVSSARGSARTVNSDQ